MKLGKFLSFNLLLVGLFSNFDANAEIQSIESIKKTAKEFLEQQFSADSDDVTIRIGKVDPRLRLQACSQPLTAFIPTGTDLKGNAIVGIRCVGAQSWHIYLPVHLAILKPVYLFSKALEKGQVIKNSDLTLKKINISRLRDIPVTKKEQIVGSTLKRRVSEGMVVSARYACMVCKGEKLIIETGNRGFKVSMSGEALEDGQYGEQIKIENLKSERVIIGTVVASQKVEVDI